jgi:predicted dehydrogenase
MKKNRTVLVIGLGSMGKRRIRNLHALGFTSITGYDIKASRREEAERLYGIKTIDSLSVLNREGIYAFIISVPPDSHHVYMKMASEMNIHFFVEASVVDTDYEEIIAGLKTKKIIAAPSATLFFHPAIRKIYEIVKSGGLGTVSNFIYHAGQYLPDWHTYESVADYYVSKRETGGAREIVPYELSWITKLFGFPENVTSIVKKTIEIAGAETIDDTYNVLLNYRSFTVNLIVDVVSRYATRRLVINGSDRQLVWSWDESSIRIFDPQNNRWETIEFSTGSAAEGYNKNITEQMYIEELKQFFDATDGKAAFFNDLEYDWKVLKLLYQIEEHSI